VTGAGQSPSCWSAHARQAASIRKSGNDVLCWVPRGHSATAGLSRTATTELLWCYFFCSVVPQGPRRRRRHPLRVVPDGHVQGPVSAGSSRREVPLSLSPAESMNGMSKRSKTTARSRGTWANANASRKPGTVACSRLSATRQITPSSEPKHGTCMVLPFSRGIYRLPARLRHVRFAARTGNLV
jgi:hypothetical protein